MQQRALSPPHDSKSGRSGAQQHHCWRSFIGSGAYFQSEPLSVSHDYELDGLSCTLCCNITFLKTQLKLSINPDSP